MKYRDNVFISSNFPPLSDIEDNSFDTVISFQVIEHIQDDTQYISEIERILRPGGVALITTPNIKMTLTRNPWHVREYTSEELNRLCRKYFSQVDVLGISGNSKVIEYYNQNLESVTYFCLFCCHLDKPPTRNVPWCLTFQ